MSKITIHIYDKKIIVKKREHWSIQPNFQSTYTTGPQLQRIEAKTKQCMAPSSCHSNKFTFRMCCFLWVKYLPALYVTRFAKIHTFIRYLQ